MEVEFYETDEQMFKALADRREAADARVQPFQAALKPGDYCVIWYSDEGYVDYVEILDPMLNAEPDEIGYLKLKYQDLKFYRYSRSHGPMNPEGELGDIHLVTVTAPLTEAQYKMAEKEEWPQDAKFVGSLLAEEPHHPAIADVMAHLSRGSR